MRPEETDAAHLWDMREAGRAIQGFLKDCSAEAYLQNPLLQAAVERKIEIIGVPALTMGDFCHTPYDTGGLSDANQR